MTPQLTERSERKLLAEWNPTPSGGMYHVYVLEDRRNHQLYYGYTRDLQRRFTEHQERAPWHLVYYEAYASEADARRREWQLKHHAQALTALKGRLRHSLGVGFNSRSELRRPGGLRNSRAH